MPEIRVGGNQFLSQKYMLLIKKNKHVDAFEYNTSILKYHLGLALL